MSNMRLCPADIEFLIHCHCSPGEYPLIETATCQRSIERFLRMGLLERIENSSYELYHTTAKGHALIDYWCNTSDGVVTWKFEHEEN